VTDSNLTPAEERARTAALAEFDREAEIVLARWRKWLETHPIAPEAEDAQFFNPAHEPAGSSIGGQFAHAIDQGINVHAPKQLSEVTWQVGDISGIPLVYANSVGKFDLTQDQLQEFVDKTVKPALSGIAPNDERLVSRYTIIKDNATLNAMGAWYDAETGKTGINIYAKTNGLPIYKEAAGELVHEIGHARSFALTQTQARSWLEATGWQGDMQDAVGVIRKASTNDMKPYGYRGPTEYGSFHPAEAFAETYRLRYGSKLPAFRQDVYEDIATDLQRLLGEITT
jgi:hypothetical protein